MPREKWYTGPPPLPDALVQWSESSAKWQDLARTTLATTHSDTVQVVQNDGTLGGYIELDIATAPFLDTATMAAASLQWTSNGRMKLADADDLTIVSGQGFEVLVVLNSSQAGSNKGVTGKWQASSANEWVLLHRHYASPNQVAAQVNVSGAAVTVVGAVGETVTDGADHVLHMWVDTSDVLHLGIDGTEVAAGGSAIGTLPANQASPLWFGAYADSTVTSFVGNIRAYRIYPEALSDAQRAVAIAEMTA